MLLSCFLDAKVKQKVCTHKSTDKWSAVFRQIVGQKDSSSDKNDEPSDISSDLAFAYRS